MTPQQRIRLARRHAGLSQASLGAAVGVQRSAVGHWEAARGKFPSVAHLREVALITGVQFEWLATGRGSMLVAGTMPGDGGDTATGTPVGDAQEGELLRAFRDVPLQSRPVLVELAQQLARQRLGPRAAAKPTTLMHALRLRLGDDPGPLL